MFPFYYQYQTSVPSWEIIWEKEWIVYVKWHTQLYNWKKFNVFLETNNLQRQESSGNIAQSTT